MEQLNPDELERFAENDTLTEDAVLTLRRRAEADPTTWMVSPGSAGYAGEPVEPITLSFVHKPTKKSYSFGYAKANKIWFKLPQQT